MEMENRNVGHPLSLRYQKTNQGTRISLILKGQF